jgi:hypothetical protein
VYVDEARLLFHDEHGGLVRGIALQIHYFIAYQRLQFRNGFQQDAGVIGNDQIQFLNGRAIFKNRLQHDHALTTDSVHLAQSRLRVVRNLLQTKHAGDEVKLVVREGVWTGIQNRVFPGIGAV